MADRTLYLIRHGQYFPNDYSEEDKQGHLNELGKTQAQLIANRLKTFPITAIHASPMIRAYETSQIISKALGDQNIAIADVLCECIPCFPKEHAHLFKEIAPGSLSDARTRADRAFERYFKGTKLHDKYDLIVCHGNIIRYLICKALRVEPETWVRMEICNCSLNIVKISQKGFMKLITFNDTGHLPDEMKTFN